MTQARRSETGAALQQLRKVLELERKLRYEDKAVYGGLDGFFRTLLERNGLPAESPVARAIRSLPSGGYRRLSAAARRRWLEQTLAALAEEVARRYPGIPLYTREIGPVIGVHGGPGLIGLAVVLAEEPPEERTT